MTLSRQANLAHRQLADSVWATNEWPLIDDPATLMLARATPKQWPRILQELRRLGWHRHGRRLYNHDIAETLREAHSIQAVRRAAGKLGSQGRWHSSKPPSDSPAPARPPRKIPSSPSPKKHHAEGIGKGIGKRMPTAMPLQLTVNSPEFTVNSPDLAVNSERLARTVSARKGSASGEKAFLEQVSQAMRLFAPKTAQDEIVNWGGWWRNRYRENPAKATRIIAEIASMIREKRILSNPGAAAHDLWKRLP
jgi:hypothetical protein